MVARYDAEGQWIPTEGEQLINERQQRAEVEKVAEEARSRADRLAERLRALGIDPDEV